MRRRTWTIATSAVALLLAAALVGSVGCAERTVRVESGTRVVCTYGEVVSSNVKLVEVPASKAADYKIVTKTVLCTTHEKVEKLYAEAQAALVRGDVEGARKFLDQVIQLDAAYRKAAEQAKLLDEHKTAVPDTSTPTPTPPSPPGDQVPIGPVANLSDLVPATLAGYTAQPLMADVYALTREYVPTTAPVGSLVVVVEQFKDDAAAAAALKSGPKRDYSAGGSTFKVKGRDVFFGTDGSRFAIVSWTDGAILVIAEAGVKTGSVAGLKTPLTDVANVIVR